MSHQMSELGHLGSHAFNHHQSHDAEQEYDRLRDSARREAVERSSCFDQAHQAYERGDGKAAHDLSEKGKRHGAQMEAYNKQASEFIFRENNAESRVPSDTIDLHGQYVEEAEEILQKRIRHARSTSQSHLHVIVGKGSHSRNHVQKLKPAVETICHQLGLQYHTEDNEGRIYIHLGPGSADAPVGSGTPTHHGDNQAYPGQQSSHGGPQKDHYEQPGETPERGAQKLLPRMMRKLEKQCCIVM